MTLTLIFRNPSANLARRDLRCPPTYVGVPHQKMFVWSRPVRGAKSGRAPPTESGAATPERFPAKKCVIWGPGYLSGIPVSELSAFPAPVRCGPAGTRRVGLRGRRSRIPASPFLCRWASPVQSCGRSKLEQGLCQEFRNSEGTPTPYT